MSETLSDIGEIDLLNRLRRFMPEGQIDNDTAEIQSCKKNMLINTDLLVENIHFNELTMTPKDIGWKAIATNFSDLVSSGVEEFLGITVGLVAPPSTTWQWIEEVYKGIDEALQTYGGYCLGGDCSAGSEKMLSITAIGSSGFLKLHRGLAKPGDLLVSSGPHGLSRLGLAILEQDPITKTQAISKKLIKQAVQSHQHPIVPIKALKLLEVSKPDNIRQEAAATDTSDGLLQAIQNICISSECQAILDINNLPKSIDWPSGKEWNKWCLTGGEDYELIVSLPEEWAEAWLKRLPSGTIIGSIKKGPPEIRWSTGEVIERNKFLSFKHY